MAYLSCFIVSIFFAYIAERAANKATFIACSAISLMITIALAALRDYSIGVDTLGYLQKDIYWQGAASFKSLTGYLKYYMEYGKNEPIFALFIGAIAQISGSYRVFLLLAQTVIMVGLYIGAYRMRDYSNPVLTLLLFYLLYYNYTLNATRQYMALAILFAGIHDLEEGKYKRYLLLVLITSMIHKISILGIGLFFMHYFLYGREKKVDAGSITERKKVSILRRSIIGVFLISMLCFFQEISYYLIKIGILNSNYLIYLDSESNASFLASRIFLSIEVIFLMLSIDRFRRNNVHPDFFIFCTIAFLLLFQLSVAIKTGARIARFFSVINITTIGMMIHCQRKQYKLLYCVIVVAMALVYWLYTYAYSNYSYTFPYAIGI